MLHTPPTASQAQQISHATPTASTGWVVDTIDVREQGLAHAYEQLAQAIGCCLYTDFSEVLVFTQNCKDYCNFIHYEQEFAYCFKEYRSDDFDELIQFHKQNNYSVSGRCFSYCQPNPSKSDDNGFSLFEYQINTQRENITIPNALFALDATTYIYRGILRLLEAITYACGPRCIRMWAHKARGHGKAPEFFESLITISEVHNATKFRTASLI